VRTPGGRVGTCLALTRFAHRVQTLLVIDLGAVVAPCSTPAERAAVARQLEAAQRRYSLFYEEIFWLHVDGGLAARDRGSGRGEANHRRRQPSAAYRSRQAR